MPKPVQEAGAERVRNKAIYPFPLYNMPFNNHELGTWSYKWSHQHYIPFPAKGFSEGRCKEYKVKKNILPLLMLYVLGIINYKITVLYIRIMDMYPWHLSVPLNIWSPEYPTTLNSVFKVLQKSIYIYRIIKA